MSWAIVVAAQIIATKTTGSMTIVIVLSVIGSNGTGAALSTSG